MGDIKNRLWIWNFRNSNGRKFGLIVRLHKRTSTLGHITIIIPRVGTTPTTEAKQALSRRTVRARKSRCRSFKKLLPPLWTDRSLQPTQLSRFSLGVPRVPKKVGCIHPGRSRLSCQNFFLLCRLSNFCFSHGVSKAYETTHHWIVCSYTSYDVIG